MTHWNAFAQLYFNQNVMLFMDTYNIEMKIFSVHSLENETKRKQTKKRAKDRSTKQTRDSKRVENNCARINTNCTMYTCLLCLY